ncbi:mannosyltransferase putative-domain-containing protein [Thelonectria olida]|uniref:Mannosyltransferase putative-domain-containing protein n=1 Tax=Thelonectria olida TaxID=1576542 RepID=A0A9P8VYW2_9HYPO|nr:mannosyltransferase putative-domain-containing protein [Thelonectria olida]
MARGSAPSAIDSTASALLSTYRPQQAPIGVSRRFPSPSLSRYLPFAPHGLRVTMAMPTVLRLKAPSFQTVSAVGFIWIFIFVGFTYWDVGPPRKDASNTFDRVKGQTDPELQSLQPIALGARYFLDYPLAPPYRDIFGQLGQRARILRSWIDELEADIHDSKSKNEKDRETVAELVERVTVSLFPYLKSPGGEKSPQYPPPLADIRTRIGLKNNGTTTTSSKSPSAGIVIPTGDKTLRFACHLIASLTRVHKTQLPIQVVYAGDKDLSAKGRRALQEAGDGRKIELLDVLTVFDDSTLKLAEGGWAIKPFAALASQYDQVILLDADTVFLQDPTQLLEQDRYKETGVMLFHDRLLWKNGFAERQDWWHEQLKHPSKETEKSLVWTERYSEEGDSGLVLVDKTRLDVLIGLLHIGWQNSNDVREEWTYKITYGDKETWWIGFEATESTYAFSPHYGGIVGWLKDEEGEKREEKKELSVCSFVIAHVDQTDTLLWYNGGLLKNKIVNQTAFEVPTHWMIDQEWHKGSSKREMSCMTGTVAKNLTQDEKSILSKAIDVAKEVDEKFGLIDWSA